MHHLGQLKMPAEVWEFFKAAMMTLDRSRTEDYFFRTGVRYEQPKDGREYPDQHCLEIDSSILTENGLNEVRMGDRRGPKQTAEPEIVTATKGCETEVEMDQAVKGSGHDAINNEPLRITYEECDNPTLTFSVGSTSHSIRLHATADGEEDAKQLTYVFGAGGLLSTIKEKETTP